MKSALVAAPAIPLVVRKPPFFVVACLAIWTAALVIAFTHPASLMAPAIAGL